MKINDKLYNVLKYLALIGLPAFASFWMVVGAIWQVGYTDEVVKTIVAFGTLLGALLVINQVKYNSSDDKYDGTIDPFYANAAVSNTVLHIPLADENTEIDDDSFPKKDVLLKVQPAPIG